MLARLRYILPVVVLLGFAGWMYSDDIPKPDLVGAVQNLQHTLMQLQQEIKDLQSSVKELAKGAKDAQKQKVARVSEQQRCRNSYRGTACTCSRRPGSELATGSGSLRARKAFRGPKVVGDRD